jgi:hypothetical protein
MKIGDKMNKKQLVLKKWNNILYGGFDKGVDDCPYCEKYYDDGCFGCPIKKKTGKCYCAKTPYIKFCDNAEECFVYSNKNRAVKCYRRIPKPTDHWSQEAFDAVVDMIKLIESLPDDVD